jgi:hypothetical protein
MSAKTPVRYWPCPQCAGTVRARVDPGGLPAMVCTACGTWFMWRNHDALAMESAWVDGIVGMAAVWAKEAAERARGVSPGGSEAKP